MKYVWIVSTFTSVRMKRFPSAGLWVKTKLLTEITVSKFKSRPALKAYNLTAKIELAWHKMLQLFDAFTLETSIVNWSHLLYHIEKMANLKVKKYVKFEV